MTDDFRQSLRMALRDRRSRLPLSKLKQNALDLKLQLSDLKEVTAASELAGYMAVNGEMDVAYFLNHSRSIGTKTWLPVVKKQKLQFAPLTDQTEFRPGKFNIPVPVYEDYQLLSAQQLDVVLVPLVAFDEKLNRLGMGGGFYDRSFSFRADKRIRPLLIGVAHECQKVSSLQAETWDVPMDMIVTESTVYRN